MLFNSLNISIKKQIVKIIPYPNIKFTTEFSIATSPFFCIISRLRLFEIPNNISFISKDMSMSIKINRAFELLSSFVKPVDRREPNEWVSMYDMLKLIAAIINNINIAFCHIFILLPFISLNKLIMKINPKKYMELLVLNANMAMYPIKNNAYLFWIFILELKMIVDKILTKNAFCSGCPCRL